MEKIKIYDIGSYIKKAKGNQYDLNSFDKVAIIKTDVHVYIMDSEACGMVENCFTDSFYLNMYSSEYDDNGKVKSISILPVKMLLITIDEVINNCESREMYMDEFFARRNYNSRLRSNFNSLVDSLVSDGFNISEYYKECFE